MPSIHDILLFFAGMLFGLLIGLINRKMIISVADQFGEYPPGTAKRKLLVRYLLRYSLNFLALLVTYRWVPALLGTALGLIIMQKTLIVQYIFLRKGVKK